MKLAVMALTLGVSYAQSSYACHIYSRWYYPHPQRCGVYARTSIPARVLPSSVPTPPDRGGDIPLPDMSANWGGTLDSELELSMQRQKALRQLSQGSN
jgi:hypothetical protein